MFPSPLTRLLVIYPWIRIQPLLGLAGRLLHLAFDFLSLSLHLFSCISGEPSNRIANPAFNLLGPTLDAVLGTLGSHVLFVSHFSPPV